MLLLLGITYMRMDDLTAWLSQHPLFVGVPQLQLQWLEAHCQQIELAEGEYLFKKDQPIEFLLIMRSGKVEAFFLQNGQKRVFAEYEPPFITGKLPYSRMEKAAAFGIALEPSSLLGLHERFFPEMIRQHYELTSVFVQQMSNRIRDFTYLQQQQEKMVSLGKLSAGLAHELNNPVSAIVRGSDALRKHLSNTPEKFKAVISMPLTPEQVDQVNELLFARMKALGNLPHQSLLEKNRLEEDLTDWLEAHQVEEPYDLAASLAEARFERNDLEQISQVLPAQAMGPVLQWIENNLITERMVIEIDEASRRIAGLVESIKGYSQMDKAPSKQVLALEEGIRNTLVLLNYKLKSKEITVSLHIHPELPVVEGYAGELNQVWTNLIDNAIDAMDKGGKLSVSIQLEREMVRIDIEDSGSGIPEEILGQIFDPFFTTKEIGKGTGLGLDIVSKIVSHHNGKISVKSIPGQTVFTVCLPASVH
jgi:signal transduction histidine kinase